MQTPGFSSRRAAQLAALLIVTVGAAQAGPIAEIGEAGQTTATAQHLGAATTSILGQISTADRADLYRFFHPGGDFGATTVGTSGTLSDTQLFLFNALGEGIIGSDDVSGSNFRSAISLGNLASGVYFLGISDFGQDPIDASSIEIFTDNSLGVQSPIAGRGPLFGWNAPSISTGTYTIDLRTPTGSEATVPVPGTLPLAGLGLLGIWAARRRHIPV